MTKQEIINGILDVVNTSSEAVFKQSTAEEMANKLADRIIWSMGSNDDDDEYNELY